MRRASKYLLWGSALILVIGFPLYLADWKAMGMTGGWLMPIPAIALILGLVLLSIMLTAEHITEWDGYEKNE